MAWVGLAVAACSGPPEAVVASVDRDDLSTIERSSGCFAADHAIGDFDGDGERELAVLAPACKEDRLYPGSDLLALRVEVFDGLLETQPARTIEIDLPEAPDVPSTFDVRLFSARLGDGPGASLIVERAFPDQHWLIGDPLGSARVAYDSATGETWMAGDLNGDGIDEIVTGRGRSGASGIYAYDSGALQLLGRLDGEPRTVWDVDADGDEDLIVWHEGRTLMYPGCRGDATCIFDWPGVGLSNRKVHLLPDLDGDGWPERVHGDDWRGGHLRLSGAADDRPVLSLYPTAHQAVFRWVWLYDVTGDGERDLLVRSGEGMHVVTGPELRPRADWTWAPAPGFALVAATVLADADGDEVGDLLLVERSSTATRLRVVGGGQVPSDALPRTLQSGLACEPTRAEGPDLGVDAELLRDSLERESQHFEADRCEVLHGCVGGAGARDLLHFSVAIVNWGSEEALLPSPMSAPDLYEFDECHGHHHVIDFASYELVAPASGAVVTGRKQGYRLADVHPYCTDVPARPWPTDWEDDNILSPGWADIYPAGLSCQWIDITGVPDGDYELRIRVNDSRAIAEDDLVPNETSLPIRLQDGDAVTARGGP